MNNFRGELTDNSAEKEALVLSLYHSCSDRRDWALISAMSCLGSADYELGGCPWRFSRTSVLPGSFQV